MTMSRFLPYILGVYLGVGSCLGALVWKSIPAMNGLGWAYLAVSWPLWLEASPVQPPVPKWVFSFPTAETEKEIQR